MIYHSKEMYLVGEYRQSFPLHLRGTVTLVPSQASSLIGTPRLRFILSQIILLTFAKSTGITQVEMSKK